VSRLTQAVFGISQHLLISPLHVHSCPFTSVHSPGTMT